MNIFRRRLSPRLFWGLPLLLATLVHADFYISPTGSDQGTGTPENPFGTLERARDAIRELKRKGTFPGRGLRVWLRGGDYIRTNAFELTAQDSGTEVAPIGWHPFFNEPVRFLGGRILTGFQPVTNATVLARLDPAARERVRQIDLRALGIVNFGEMKSRGFGRPTTPAHEELFYAGRPMTLARWPNEGSWEKIAGIPDTTTKGDEHGGKLGDLPGGFFYGGDRPKRWQDVTDIWVHGYWAWDWANSYERVAELDRDRHFLKTAPPYGLYGFRPGQRFQFLNILEELDQPGEWYLDRPHGLLYFWPPDAPPSQSGAEPETVLSLLAEPFLKLSGSSFLTFRGFTFEATRASAVEIQGGISNRLIDCHLRNLGNAGVIVSGGTGHGVLRCDLFDTGDGGVTLSGGDRQTLTPGGHYVENSHFQRQGRWSKCYVPAIQMDGVGQRASHNLIHDHPHAAILFNGNDHLIEFNDIHHIALESGDVGAIYTGRDYTYRGNRIR